MARASIPKASARRQAALAALLAIALSATAICARAQSPPQSPSQPPPASQLAGTLQKVRASGAVTLAYRESSLPFSYLSQRGEPIGYSIDLCLRVVEAMRESLGREITVRWLPVTSDSRIPAIAEGRADLECGSTSATDERRRQVAFSPVIFISGTKLLVPAGSPIRSFRDLAGKPVAVTAGTTNQAAMLRLNAQLRADARLAVVRDHDEAYASLAAGKAAAVAGDDVLLYGMLAQHRSGARFRVAGDYLSYDPYALMYRKGDAQMDELVRDTFKRLAREGEWEERYRKWFMTRLPAGPALGIPMSAQLEAVVATQANLPD